MYTQLDVVADAEGRAQSAALRDRERYQKFVEAAEQFAAQNELIVGGASATRLLLGAPVALDSFQYDFYSGQALSAARALGDALHAVDPQGLGHYVTVLTKTAGHFFVIEVDGRAMFTVTSLPVYRGVRTADVVIPSHRPARFAKGAELACTGPEIQLMGVYAALCNPDKAGAWGGLLATEARLRALFAGEIRAKIAQAVARTGGGAPPRTELVRALYREFVAGPDRVLVGKAAAALLGGRPPGGERIQVVSVMPLEREAAAVAEIGKRHGVEVQWVVNDPKIPTDPRLRRMTLYAVQGHAPGARREAFMDVFNAAAHELIPFVTAGAAMAPRGGRDAGRRFEHRRGPRRADADEGAAPGRADRGRRDRGRDRGERGDHGAWAPPAGTKLGTPFVLLRFRLADMWTIQVLLQMGAINAAFAKETLHDMLQDCEAVAAHYTRVLDGAAANPEEAAAQLLPLANYVGRFGDPDIALKRAAPARFFAPYVPAAGARPREPES